jgi:aryl-alcohol dehydrogenase-like predicted oxidoreductase
MASVPLHVTIETSIKALAELVTEGKIEGIGLNEINADIIRRASNVHKIAAKEIEMSLFTPDPFYNCTMDSCDECKSFYILLCSRTCCMLDKLALRLSPSTILPHSTLNSLRTLRSYLLRHGARLFESLRRVR